MYISITFGETFKAFEVIFILPCSVHNKCPHCYSLMYKNGWGYRLQNFIEKKKINIYYTYYLCENDGNNRNLVRPKINFSLRVRNTVAIAMYVYIRTNEKNLFFTVYKIEYFCCITFSFCFFLFCDK